MNRRYKDTDLAWAAGIIEGEGHLQARQAGPHWHQIYLTVGMHKRDKDVLHRLQQLFGGIIYGPYGIYPDILYWKITDGARACHVAAQIYDWLSPRRIKQANRMFDAFFKRLKKHR